jgi:RNA polymerase sigma factor for flagellar operon FliA
MEGNLTTPDIDLIEDATAPPEAIDLEDVADVVPLALVELDDVPEELESVPAPTYADEDELTRMVKDYMPLVRHAVNRIVAGSSQSTILQYEDMVSCGVQGLLEAYKTYDPNRGAKFSTYALPRIRGSILDALRAAHPLPRSLQKVSSDIEKAVTALYGDLGRTPTKAEIAQRLGIPLGELLSLSQSSSIRVLSLESLADMTVNGATEKLTEMADDDPGIDPHTVAQRGQLRGQLLDAIDELPDREREIIRLYYIESRSLKSIGRAMAISESRASQLRHRAIRRLRSALNTDMAEAA